MYSAEFLGCPLMIGLGTSAGGPARDETAPSTREDLSRGTGSGFLRKSTGANGRKRFSTNTYRKPVWFLQKYSGSLRDNEIIQASCTPVPS